MAKLILVRHGQTDWDVQRRFQGTLDIPLNHEGQKEAQELSEKLNGTNISAVYAGTKACALSTAREIAAPRNIKVRKLEELNELNYGMWQGLRVEDVKKRYKKHYGAWKTEPISARPPKGESLTEAYDRAVSALHKILDKNKDENVCIVSHDIICSLIKCHLKCVDPNGMWDFIPRKIEMESFEINRNE